MLDVLHNYLVDAASPDLLQEVTRAHELFERIELPDYELGFMDILMTLSYQDGNDAVGSIYSLTCDILRQLLGEHGIKVDEEVKLPILTRITEGVIGLLDHDNKADILQTASLDHSPEEVFCELMALVTDLNPDEMLFAIEEVTPYFIGKVKDLTVEAPIVDEQEIAERNERFRLINNFRRLYTAPINILNAVINGLDVGYPFVLYAEQLQCLLKNLDNESQQGHDLEGLTNEEVAAELIVMTMLSGDGLNSPRAIIAANIEKYISDMDRITKITIRINELLLELEREKA